MPNKIGRFEVLTEITHSEIGSVYKASDPESGQTVTLKTLRLELLGEQAAAMVQSVVEEAETGKALNSHNIAALYGAGEIEGQLVACVEYVQGNSIATMLARKEGFSIWDLQDIARQACQGLDHAHTHKVVHYSLEPAKIMVQWDGIVKMLGFGISHMGTYSVQASGRAADVLHYMSPEQLRGDPVDSRSNLFSLGAILYEMVTERKAFEGEDADQVRQTIQEMTPVAPYQINRKVHPVLSEVIMKALSKLPEERYQSGQELVNDLERCKESATKATAKKPAQPQGVNAAQKAKPAASAAIPTAKPASAPATVAKAVTPKAEEKSRTAWPTPSAKAPEPVKPVAPPVAREEFAVQQVDAPAPDAPVAHSPGSKAAAAAAGWDSGDSTTAVGQRTPKLDPSSQFISTCVKASVEAFTQEEERMSAAPVAEPEVEEPGIAIDPMMDESRRGSAAPSRSFSEIDELPPLKEIFIAPPAPPQPEPAAEPRKTEATLYMGPAEPEKPRVQPREVAKKAVTEIKKTPPKLFMYSIAGAICVILLIVVAIAFHIRSENSDDDVTPVAAPVATPADPASSSGAGQAGTQSGTRAQAQPPVQVAPEAVSAEPAVSVKPKYNKKQPKVKPAAPVATVIPGQLTINTTPEGAQVHVDGQNDPSWVTPYNLTGLTPGQHSVTVSKPGFGTETRTIDVTSGSKSFLVVQMAQLAATVTAASEPTGASIFIDGKDTGKVTPAQISVDKAGSHTFLFRKQGYLDQMVTATLQSGQTFHLAPALQALGNTNEIKTVGKLKKMFGGSNDTVGMGLVSVKTTPKGAQVMVNNRMLDKVSPVDFYLNPGNYVIDITASGFKPIHRVINIDKGNKVAMDETMERE